MTKIRQPKITHEEYEAIGALARALDELDDILAGDAEDESDWYNSDGLEWFVDLITHGPREPEPLSKAAQEKVAEIAELEKVALATGKVRKVITRRGAVEYIF